MSWPRTSPVLCLALSLGCFLFPLVTVSTAAPAVEVEEKAPPPQHGGISVMIRSSDARLLIHQVLPGGPAEKVGLKAWDEIVQIDEEWIPGMGMEAAIALIRGEPGTRLNLFVRRRGQPQPLKFTLVREILNIPKEIPETP